MRFVDGNQVRMHRWSWKFVEIDESYMAGHQKNGKGQKLGEVEDDPKCTWVFPWNLGAIERGTLHYFVEHIQGPWSTEVLLPILMKWILPGTIVMADKRTAYIDLDYHLKACAQHLTVNHKENFVDPMTGAHTQGIESL